MNGRDQESINAPEWDFRGIQARDFLNACLWEYAITSQDTRTRITALLSRTRGPIRVTTWNGHIWINRLLPNWDAAPPKKAWAAPWHYEANLRLARLLEAYGREFPKPWNELPWKEKRPLAIDLGNMSVTIELAKQTEDPIRYLETAFSGDDFWWLRPAWDTSSEEDVLKQCEQFLKKEAERDRGRRQFPIRKPKSALRQLAALRLAEKGLRYLDVEDYVRCHFWTDDFRDFAGLAQKLRARTDPVSRFIWCQFSAEAKAALTNGVPNGERQIAILAEALNGVLKMGSLYSSKRFDGVSLSPETQRLKSQSPEGKTLIPFNRLLLEDVFQKEIVKSRAKAFRADDEYLLPLFGNASSWSRAKSAAARILKTLEQAWSNGFLAVREASARASARPQSRHRRRAQK